MDKGKSSHVSFVENPVTSHRTVDRSISITKTPYTIIRDQQVLLETNKALPCVWQLKQEEGAIRVVDDRSVADDRTPHQRATDWLSGVADENDKVKDIIMQELWGKEDFQNT
jgi:hypothetical protein